MSEELTVQLLPFHYQNKIYDYINSLAIPNREVIDAEGTPKYFYKADKKMFHRIVNLLLDSPYHVMVVGNDKNKTIMLDDGFFRQK